MRKRTSLIWLVLMVFVAAVPGWADTIYVDGAGQTAVDDDRAAAVELVQSAVGELGHRVTEDSTKADYILRPRLLRLGSAYILKMDKRKGGQVVFSTQLKAQQAEELDRVAKRLTRAVIANQPAGESAHVGEVTNEEATQGTQRRPVVQKVHFALGPAVLQNMGVSGIGYSFTFGTAWDMGNAMIGLRGDLFGNGGALGIDFGLSGRYFLFRTDYSPFFGAELGFGGARSDTGTFLSDDLHGGFFVGPVAGLQLFRTSSVQVELGLKWSILLAQSNPNYFAFRVGLYF